MAIQPIDITKALRKLEEAYEVRASSVETIMDKHFMANPNSLSYSLDRSSDNEKIVNILKRRYTEAGWNVEVKSSPGGCGSLGKFIIKLYAK